MNEIKVSINRNGLLSKKMTFKILNNGHDIPSNMFFSFRASTIWFGQVGY
jgi:hypothetical protein